MRHPLASRASRLVLLPCLAIALATGLALAGEAKTPLGKWMKPNMGAPMAGGDLATVQKSLTLVSGKVPSGNYGNWASLASKGATAAGAGDTAAVKAACKGCHDQYKQQYITDHLADPFP